MSNLQKTIWRWFVTIFLAASAGINAAQLSINRAQHKINQANIQMIENLTKRIEICERAWKLADTLRTP